MTYPANANYPISPSFNVMGPHPLTYPQSIIERENEILSDTKSVQTDAVPSSSYHNAASRSTINKNELHDIKNETADEIPQDLSFNNKDANIDEVASTSNLTRNNEMQTRPQIIVSSRKMINEHGVQSREYEATLDFSSCRSPSKSVIVRAGSSTVSKLIN